MKKKILLFAIFALSIYFYNKKSTDFLLIMCLFIIFISTINFSNLFEHAENVSQGTASNEAIQNLASIYNSKKMIVDEIEANKITVKGKTKDFVVQNGWISSSDGINCNGLNSADYVKAKGSLIVGENDNLKLIPDGAANATIQAKNRLHIGGDEYLFLLNKSGTIVGNEWGGTGNLQVRGNVYLPEKKSYVVGQVALSEGNSNFVAYRTSDGHNLFLSNHKEFGFNTPHGGAGRVGGWNAYNDAGVTKP